MAHKTKTSSNHNKSSLIEGMELDGLELQKEQDVSASEPRPSISYHSPMGAVPQSDISEYDIDQQWEQVLGHLRAEFAAGVYESWFKRLHIVNIEEGCAIMAAPTRFVQNWLETHFGDRIKGAWTEVNSEVHSISIVVMSGFKTPISSSQKQTSKTAVKAPASAGGQRNISASNVIKETARMAGQAKMAPLKKTALSQKKPPFQNTPPFQGAAAFQDREKAQRIISPQKVRVAVTDDGLHEYGAPLDPRFTFESFVVGKSNELAYAAAQRVAENNAVNFNPLFLHGGVGLGKTHLLHAIAWANQQKFPDRRVVYLSAEQFMYQFVASIRYKDTMAFKQKFRSVDLLMIDDLQFIANKESTQEEFFHTFNALIDHHRQVVVSADRSPTDLDGIEERIRSRLGWGLVADIHPTDYELRLGILQQKANGVSDLDIPVEVLEFLARRITSNVRELEGALNRMVAHATLIGRPISLDMTREVLQDLLRANDRRVTVDEIQRRVADYFNIRLSDLLSARRARQVARPRQMAMYLAKQMTSKSLPEIGRQFGGRDHTTVMHAVKRIEELTRTDSTLADDLVHLERILGT
jgi:chromosomal replication initiator protein